MKRTFFLLTFLTFTPLYTYGDFVPGRVRASAEADLVRIQGDGRYQNVRNAHALQFQTDGKGITAYTVSLDGRPDARFVVSAVQPNRCGRTFVAKIAGSDLRIEETRDSCREDGKLVWRVQLTTTESAAAVSHLTLSGDPEYFMLTQ